MRWVLAFLMLLVVAPSAAADDDIGVLHNLGVTTRDSDPWPSATLPDGIALIAADDGVHGRELWRSDGTAAGTQLVADLLPGPAPSAPYGFDVVGNLAYFFAFDEQWGREVWRTDGTAAGTRKLADLSAPAPEARSVAADTPDGPFHAIGNEVAFLVSHIEGFYIAAVGPGGGARVLDVLGPGEWNDLTIMGSTGDALFFRRGGKLYRTDGTRAGTREIAVDHSVSKLVAVGGHVAIAGWSFERDGELSILAPGALRATVLDESGEFMRVIDGRLYYANRQGLRSWAPGEFVRTVDAHAPAEGSFGVEFAKLGDQLVYVVSRLPGEGQLYIPGKGPFGLTADNISFLRPIGNGRALFHAWDTRIPGGFHSLWVTDGTEAGTVNLTGEQGLGLGGVAATRNGAIFPDHIDRAGVELWRTDGTAANTAPLLDINRVPVGSGPSAAARVGGRIVFRTYEDGGLWTTDGTAAGTQPLREAILPSNITSDGATAYFSARDGALHRTDGTAGGTRKVADLGIQGHTFRGLGVVGGALVFSGGADFDHDVWRTDGTATGTRKLLEHVGSYPSGEAAGERTLLVAGDYTLYRTDGNTASQAYGIAYGSVGMAQAVADGFLASRYTETEGFELFHLDRDGADPRLVADVDPGVLSSNPRAFGRAGEVVLFIADRYDFPPRWYVTDGERVMTLGGLQGGPAGFPPVTVGGVTYIVNRDGYDVLLYRTDGTEAGTVLLQRFAFADDELPLDFAHFNGTTWFAAYEAEHGRELWRTDGTPGGTRLARDIRPGRASSDPLDLVATDEFLFFTAFDDVNGAEPWRIRRAAPPADPPVDPPGEDPPPVTIAPITPAPVTPQVRPPAPTSAAKATVTIRVQRLRKLRGRTRWRVSGVATAGACSGPVKIVLGRRDRALKTTRAKLTGCGFRVIVSTTSRSSGRWLQVRASGATSRRVTVR